MYITTSFLYNFIRLLTQLEMLYFVIHIFLESIKCLHSHTAVLFWRVSKLENPIVCARDLTDFQIKHSSRALMSSSFSSLGTRHFDLVPPPSPRNGEVGVRLENSVNRENF
jgi:hypothetical protein